MQDEDIIDIKALIDGRNLALKELSEAIIIFQKGREKKKPTENDISKIRRHLKKAKRILNNIPCG